LSRLVQNKLKFEQVQIQSQNFALLFACTTCSFYTEFNGHISESTSKAVPVKPFMGQANSALARRQAQGEEGFRSTPKKLVLNSFSTNIGLNVRDN